MLTPGMMAPDESVTAPTTVPWPVCALATVTPSNGTINEAARQAWSSPDLEQPCMFTLPGARFRVRPSDQQQN